MGYSAETDVEALLGTSIDGTTTPTSTQVATFISWADNYIDTYTGKKYSATTVTDEIYESEPIRVFLEGDVWEGSELLFLKHSPIISVTSLYRNTGSDKSPTWSLLTLDTDFVIQDSIAGAILFVQNKPKPIKRAVKITYVYGKSAVPGAVAELSAVLVAIMCLIAKGSSANAEDLGSIALGDLRVDYGGSSTSTGSGELISNLGARRDALLSILGKSGTIGV